MSARREERDMLNAAKLQQQMNQEKRSAVSEVIFYKLDVLVENF